MIAEVSPISARRAQRALWLYPNLLSLDAPVVAVLWQLLFTRCYLGRFDWNVTVTLALSVWAIYAADRVWDNSTNQARHKFHRRHWRWILPTWIVAVSAASWLSWKLSAEVRMRGMLLLIAVGIFFGLTHLLRRWPKELAVGIVFAAGVSLSAWNSIRTWADAAVLATFAALCWINCVAIEQWEQRSLSDWPVRGAAILVGLIALIFLYDQRPILAGAETASAFAFVVLDRAKSSLSSNALRVLADVALLTPLLFLPIAILRS